MTSKQEPTTLKNKLKHHVEALILLRTSVRDRLLDEDITIALAHCQFLDALSSASGRKVEYERLSSYIIKPYESFPDRILHRHTLTLTDENQPPDLKTKLLALQQQIFKNYQDKIRDENKLDCNRHYKALQDKTKSYIELYLLLNYTINYLGNLSTLCDEHLVQSTLVACMDTSPMWSDESSVFTIDDVIFMLKISDRFLDKIHDIDINAAHATWVTAAAIVFLMTWLVMAITFAATGLFSVGLGSAVLVSLILFIGFGVAAIWLNDEYQISHHPDVCSLQALNDKGSSDFNVSDYSVKKRIQDIFVGEPLDNLVVNEFWPQNKPLASGLDFAKKGGEAFRFFNQNNKLNIEAIKNEDSFLNGEPVSRATAGSR